MECSPEARDAILEQLGKVLSSETFKSSERSSTLLRYLVEQALGGNAGRLKEYTIGVDALGRGQSFDPRSDPIVRAEISRLRGRLERYYTTEGRTDARGIVLPKGSYEPRFEDRTVSMGKTPTGRQLSLSRWFVLGCVAIACVFLLQTWVARGPAPIREPPSYRFDVELRSNGELGSVVGTDVIISPDGTRIAFVSHGPDGLAHLNTRALDETQVTELPGTDGARSPFFSPDGQWVGFWASGQLKKVAIQGGLPVVLTDSPDLLGASWGDDGDIIAALSRGRLWRVPSSGGTPSVILDLASESATPAWPQVLPGAASFLFTSIGQLGANAGNIEVLSLPDGKRTVLVRGATFARYANGYLLYVNQGTLFAVPFDPGRMETAGTAVPVLTDVSHSSTFGFAQLDISRAGILVYRRDAAGGQFIAAWLDGTGNVEPLRLRPGRYSWPRLSPDGHRLALSVVESGTTNTWIYEPEVDRITRLGPTAGNYFAPAWTPDGRALILGGLGGMASVSEQGWQRLGSLTRKNTIQVPWSFTPDGTRLAYHEMSPSSAFDLWTIPLQSVGNGLTAGTPEPILNTPAFETYPSFSPDGRWLAYASNKSGSWQVYVRAYPDNGTEVLVSDMGGRIPAWSPNGQELFYRTDDQRIMVAAYTTKAGAFVPSKPRAWSQERLADTGVIANFDLAPDGNRILALMPAGNDQQTQNHVTFVLNFMDEVRRRTASSAN